LLLEALSSSPYSPDNLEGSFPEEVKQSEGKIEDARKLVADIPAMEAHWIDQVLPKAMQRGEGPIKENKFVLINVKTSKDHV